MRLCKEFVWLASDCRGGVCCFAQQGTLLLSSIQHHPAQVFNISKSLVLKVQNYIVGELLLNPNEQESIFHDIVRDTKVHFLQPFLAITFIIFLAFNSKIVVGPICMDQNALNTLKFSHSRNTLLFVFNLKLRVIELERKLINGLKF